MGGGFPETFDPQRDLTQPAVSGLDYEGLTRIDEEMNTVPGAAESWAFSDDGLVLTFHLRDNLTYADGSPLTAERFRYAVERACDPQTAAPLAVDALRRRRLRGVRHRPDGGRRTRPPTRRPGPASGCGRPTSGRWSCA